MGGATTTGGIQVVDTKSDLDSLTSKGYGNLVYVKDEDKVYYDKMQEWRNWSGDLAKKVLKLL